MKKRIVVIGGGASGMTASIAAARGGASVILLEHRERVGKKILSTGNGRCNMTNRFQNEGCYRSSDGNDAFSVIRRFGWEETVLFFRGLGVPAKEKNGYFYPRSNQASSVLDGLRFQCSRSGVTVMCGKRVKQIQNRNGVFFIQTEKDKLEADRLILACGGTAAPTTGSDGSGYQLAKQMGHSIIPVVPALVSLKSSYKGCKSLAGIRTDASVSIWGGGILLARDKGEVQLTASGISGIPVFQISRYGSYSLLNGQKTECHMDFLPDWEEKEFLFYVEQQKNRQKDCPFGQMLPGLLPKNLWYQMLKENGISLEKKAYLVNIEDCLSLVRNLKDFVFPVTASGDFSQAQVTAGGVPLNEITLASMESKRVPGLYMAGELLDVDGICGGYNLQWAWATGFLAGFHASTGQYFQKGGMSCF